MPIIIYIFSLCAFAIGFTEFISIGLAPTLATSMHASIAQIGMTVTSYALGVVIGAPILTALTAGWTRKHLLMTAMLTFTLSNIMASISLNLSMLLAARGLSGLSHGVFVAVASGIAIRLVTEQQAGRAIAWVFGGATLAIALGVPIGAWLTCILPWRWIFLLIAVCGMTGSLGIWMYLPTLHATDRVTIKHTLTTLLNRHLLAGASLPFFAYAGSFTFYTFATQFLVYLHASVQQVSAALLAYGLGAIIGNIIGGRLTDRYGIDRASFWVLAGIAVTLAAISLWGSSFIIAMQVLLLLLGLTTYGAIPPLQARIMVLAKRHCPQAGDAASGLNIAAFNAGVVVGSLVGAFVLSHWSFGTLGGVGALVVLPALASLGKQCLSKNQ